jgi:hypothetical protein
VHLERAKTYAKANPELHNVQQAVSYSEGVERYLRWVADDIENGVAVPKLPGPPGHVSAPK